MVKKISKETMKKVTILPAILLMLGALASQAKSPNLEPVVIGQTEAEVGQLVIIDSSDSKADSYVWEMICLSGKGDYRIINNGQSLIFSATEEGSYLFICAMVRGSLVDLVIHELTVVKSLIKPDPNLNDFEIMIRSWLPNDYDRIIAARLAYSFDLAASNNQGDIDSFLRLTTLSNRAALGSDLKVWVPFLKKLSDYCQKNMQDASLEEHVQLWLHVSAALRK